MGTVPTVRTQWSRIGATQERFHFLSFDWLKRCLLRTCTRTATMIDEKSGEAALRIRAVYRWERDGRQEGRLAEDLPKAPAMLDEQAALRPPIDDPPPAPGLPTIPPTC